VKNQWINAKLELELYLGMAKQCTKYQMNLSENMNKKSAEN
jgi:hypothetical protein